MAGEIAAAYRAYQEAPREGWRALGDLTREDPALLASDWDPTLDPPFLERVLDMAGAAWTTEHGPAALTCLLRTPPGPLRDRLAVLLGDLAWPGATDPLAVDLDRALEAGQPAQVEGLLGALLRIGDSTVWWRWTAGLHVDKTGSYRRAMGHSRDPAPHPPAMEAAFARLVRVQDPGLVRKVARVLGSETPAPGAACAALTELQARYPAAPDPLAVALLGARIRLGDEAALAALTAALAARPADREALLDAVTRLTDDSDPERSAAGRVELLTRLAAWLASPGLSDEETRRCLRLLERLPRDATLPGESAVWESLLTGGSMPVRRQALETLDRLGRVQLAHLESALASDEPELIRVAGYLLSRRRLEQETVELWTRALGRDEGVARALRWLAERRGGCAPDQEATVAALIRTRLADPVEDVRAAAVDAWARLETPVDWLPDVEPRVEDMPERVAEALRASFDPDSSGLTGLWQRLAEHEQAAVRSAACDALRSAVYRGASSPDTLARLALEAWARESAEAERLPPPEPEPPPVQTCMAFDGPSFEDFGPASYDAAPPEGPAPWDEPADPLTGKPLALEPEPAGEHTEPPEPNPALEEGDPAQRRALQTLAECVEDLWRRHGPEGDGVLTLAGLQAHLPTADHLLARVPPHWGGSRELGFLTLNAILSESSS